MRIKLVLFAGAAMALLAGCGGGQPDPITETGVGLHRIYVIMFWFCVAVVVGVGGAIVIFAVRYRRRAGDDELPVQYLGNNKVEFVWTIIPLIVVIVIFGLSWPQVSDAQKIAEDPALELDIEGFQWQWRFTYPDQEIEVAGVLGEAPPRLVVPANREINVTLRSEDVIHSFYIPQTLYKLDVVPGQVNEFSIEFTQEGTFTGQCAEFCGLSHAQMIFITEVVSEAEFDAFVLEQALESDVEIIAAAACAPTGSVAQLTIQDNIFDPGCIAVLPGETFDVVLTNNDADVNHNIEIYETRADYLAGEDPVFAGAEFTGAGDETYQVDGLEPGRYFVVSANADSAEAVLNVGERALDLENFGPAN